MLGISQGFSELPTNRLSAVRSAAFHYLPVKIHCTIRKKREGKTTWSSM